MTILAGSRWRYIEDDGPQQYYLNQMFNPEVGRYDEMNPRDWGACVFGKRNEDNAHDFIYFMEEPLTMMNVILKPEDREMLFKRWRR